MNAANKPHAPDPIKIRGILADTELSASARLAAVELYYHTDWMTGELICRDTIAAHIRRTIGVKMSASKTILKQLRERGYIDGVFFRPVVGGRKTDRSENRPAGKPASRTPDRSENRPPPVGKPTTPPVGKPTTPGRKTDPNTSSTSYSLPSPSSEPRRPDTRESIEERERRYAEAQRRQAEAHRRRESERQGIRRLSDEFLASIYVKGDGR